jgi:hypothetical protein
LLTKQKYRDEWSGFIDDILHGARPYEEPMLKTCMRPDTQAVNTLPLASAYSGIDRFGHFA